MGELGLVASPRKSGPYTDSCAYSALTQDDAHLFMTPRSRFEDEGQAASSVDRPVSTGPIGFRYRVELHRDRKNSMGDVEDWRSCRKRATEKSWKTSRRLPHQPRRRRHSMVPRSIFILRTAIGRGDGSAAQIQLDFQMPQRIRSRIHGP